MEGSPVTAVSLGATTGGGKMSSKAQDFNAALLALGEGWLVADDGEAEQPPPERPPPPRKGATARISTEIPCELQVCGARAARGGSQRFGEHDTRNAGLHSCCVYFNSMPCLNNPCVPHPSPPAPPPPAITRTYHSGPEP